MACAELSLDEEVVALQRMVLQEAGKTSDIAGTFYRNGIQRTLAALADWLRVQQERGSIQLDDVEEAAGMLLSHARQFYGGPPKFKPNSKLVRGFSADQSRPPVNDPNLRSQGAGRAFMNTRDQEPRPAK